MSWAPASYPRQSASPLPALLRTEACWVNLAFFLTFFPSTIFFILPSLSQPVAALAALPLLFLFPTRNGALTRWILILLFLIAGYIVVSLFIYGEIAGKILANGISYMLPPLYLLAMQNRADKISVRVYRWALRLWLAIGMIQYFSVFSLIQGPLQSVLKIFIADRFLMTHYTTDRGVMFYSSEPSTAAPIILLFMLGALFFYAQRRISRREMIFSIAASLAMASMNQSGSVAVLVVLAVVGALWDRLGALRWRTRVLAAAILALGIWGIGALTLSLNYNLRAFVVLAQFVRLADPSRLSGRTIAAGLSAIGSERVAPLLQGYGSIVDHYGVGHGIASWNIESVVTHVEKVVGISVFDFAENRSENGIYVPQGGMGQTKPQTFLATIAWDTGAPGLVTALAVILAVLSVARRQRRLSEYRYLFLVPAILHCAFFSQVPLVAPWLMMVFAMTPKPVGSRSVEVRKIDAFSPPRILPPSGLASSMARD
jgi:hypothetical protein